MSGHSHFATIKRQKGLKDAAKGNIFGKLSKMISIAIKSGGGPNPDMNFKLRVAIDKARENNMPKDNIDRILKSASEKMDSIEEITYEGFGPFGMAVVVETATDNRNRTAQEIKLLFERGGGAMGGPNSVLYNFDSKGYLLIEKNNLLSEKIQRIKDKDFEMGRLNNLLAEKTQRIKDKDFEQDKLNNLIAEKNKLLREEASKISELSLSLQKKEGQIKMIGDSIYDLRMQKEEKRRAAQILKFLEPKAIEKTKKVKDDVIKIRCKKSRPLVPLPRRIKRQYAKQDRTNGEFLIFQEKEKFRTGFLPREGISKAKINMRKKQCDPIEKNKIIEKDKYSGGKRHTLPKLFLSPIHRENKKP